MGGEEGLLSGSAYSSALQGLMSLPGLESPEPRGSYCNLQANVDRWRAGTYFPRLACSLNQRSGGALLIVPGQLSRLTRLISVPNNPPTLKLEPSQTLPHPACASLRKREDRICRLHLVLCGDAPSHSVAQNDPSQ
jgi:hypothetical protein